MLASISGASIVVNSTNAPDSINPYIEKAFHDWELFLTLSIDVKVKVVWTALPETVSASASATNYIVNTADVPIPDVYYPVALAENLSKKNLNGDDNDILIQINSLFDWSLDTTDSSVLNGEKYHLVSIIKHELAHGLGIYSSLTLDPNNNTRVLFESGYPTIFDKLVYVQGGYSIADDEVFPMPSQAVLSKILTDSIFYSGNVLKYYYPDSIVKLFTEPFFHAGRHIVHFDEDLYPIGNENALMTPYSIPGEVNGIGDLTKYMLMDLGWNRSSIDHIPLSDIEDVNLNQVVAFRINSENIDTSKIIVKYSFDRFSHFEIANFTYDASLNLFYAEIPDLRFNHFVSYTIEFEDKYQQIIKNPLREDLYNEYYVGEDSVPPTIQNVSIKRVFENSDSLYIEMNVFDNIRIENIILRIKISENIYTFEYLLSGNIAISIPEELTSLTDFLVQIEAHDGKNMSFFPNYQMWEDVPIFSNIEPASGISIDFESNVSSLFIFDGFSVKKEEGFNSFGLHTNHPYAETGLQLQERNYIAEMKIPLVLSNQNQYMSYDEVVLVEPGVEDALFGERGFWDYVIVEGTKDGENWYAFEKTGYDSRFNDVWLSSYFSSINKEENNSSNAVGYESMYVNHTINLLANKYLRQGDTINIRFRLMSDELTYAWGWAIDNIYTHGGKQSVYASKQNTCNLFLNCLYHLQDNIQIFDLKGLLVYSGYMEENKCFDFIPEGLYICYFESGEKSYLLIH